MRSEWQRAVQAASTRRRGSTVAPGPAVPPVLRLQRTHGNAFVQRLLAPALGAEVQAVRGGGAALDPRTRGEMEAAFGAGLGGVRVHTGARADTLARTLSARAFTLGNDVFFRDGEHAPSTPAGRKLLAHELAHVVQQSGSPAAAHGGVRVGPADDACEREAGRAADAVAAGAPATVSAAAPAAAVQRELVMTGTAADVDALLDILGSYAGMVLVRDPATNRVTATGSLPVVSPVTEQVLTSIIDDTAQNAEVHVGTDAPTVLVGLFPTPDDLTGSRVQTLDLDDIEALEADTPGVGAAAALHEIEENYVAHGAVPVAGRSRFPDSHEIATEVESDVMEEVVGPGRRGGEAVQVTTGTDFEMAIDFDNYYVVLDVEVDAASHNRIRSSRIETVVVVGTYTIDGFRTGSDAVPATSAATSALSSAAADVAANPLATVRLVGHTDDVADDVVNDPLSEDRAARVRDRLDAAGVAFQRMHVAGRGESQPAAPNTSDANRARNRRVVISVTRPAP